jgi:2-polyprenyl-3-methyl-5-hydroxy-6-metoxy-1,4-benzoquinol methylase
MTLKADKKDWEKAQAKEFETWHQIPFCNDDWNKWWKREFDNYSFIKDKDINSIIEVGCGPYANNMSYVLDALSKTPSKIALSDPLLNRYIIDSQPVKTLAHKLNAVTYAYPIEELSSDNKYDCVICINVLRHVYDVEKCMEKIFNILNDNGYLIFAEDLTHEDEPLKTDEMHPIWFNHEMIYKYLDVYESIFCTKIDREHGRNPSAHYETLLFCGQKQ